MNLSEGDPPGRWPISHINGETQEQVYHNWPFIESIDDPDEGLNCSFCRNNLIHDNVFDGANPAFKPNGPDYECHNYISFRTGLNIGGKMENIRIYNNTFRNQRNALGWKQLNFGRSLRPMQRMFASMTIPFRIFVPGEMVYLLKHYAIQSCHLYGGAVITFQSWVILLTAAKLQRLATAFGQLGCSRPSSQKNNYKNGNYLSYDSALMNQMPVFMMFF